MSDADLLARISINPKILIGKPVIKGTRLSVEYIVGRLAHGATTETLISEYPSLTSEDVQACLMFASKSLESTTFMPLAAEAR